MTSIQPELWVGPAGEAVVFYAKAFGACVLHQVGEEDDIVAQLAVGEAAFWVTAACQRVAWPGGSPGGVPRVPLWTAGRARAAACAG